MVPAGKIIWRSYRPDGVRVGRTKEIAAMNRFPHRLSNLQISLLLLLTQSVWALNETGPLVFYSPDITFELDGQVVRDHQIVEVDQNGIFELLGLTGLPPNASVNAFHHAGEDLYLFSLDTIAELSGIVFRPADVIAYSNGVHVLYFDSLTTGIPPGVQVNAVTEDGPDLLLSFDITVDLPGGPYFDHDLVRWDGTSFSLALDGAAAGIPHKLDINAAHLMPDGTFWLSFDTGGLIGGVRFARSDVLALYPTSGTWSMSLDHGSQGSTWLGVDLEALGFAYILPPTWPVPAMSPLGIILLVLLVLILARLRRAQMRQLSQ